MTELDELWIKIIKARAGASALEQQARYALSGLEASLGTFNVKEWDSNLQQARLALENIQALREAFFQTLEELQEMEARYKCQTLTKQC